MQYDSTVLQQYSICCLKFLFFAHCVLFYMLFCSNSRQYSVYEMQYTSSHSKHMDANPHTRVLMCWQTKIKRRLRREHYIIPNNVNITCQAWEKRVCNKSVRIKIISALCSFKLPLPGFCRVHHFSGVIKARVESS